MVLGLKTKNRKSPSVQVDFLIHIQEIKPWPPSQSLRTLRAVLIQWEHGDRSSGSTSQVVPSLGTGSGVGDGRIEFNESFRLPVTLFRELSVKSGEGNTFQKNCIEFNLYEPRRDKTVKGQLLGTAVVDLADYGVVKETLCISAAINCKRTYRNTAQPLLFLNIQSVERSQMSSSARDHLIREPSMDGNGVDSVSALMNEEYAEEAESASFTDDDVSSLSSLAVSSSAVESNAGSPLQNKENGLEGTKASEAGDEHVPALKQDLAKADDKQLTESNASLKGSSSRSSSIDLSSDLEWIKKKIGTCSAQSSLSSKSEVTDKEENINMRSTAAEEIPDDTGGKVFHEGAINTVNSTQQTIEAGISCSPTEEPFQDSDVKWNEKLDLISSFDSPMNGSLDDHTAIPSTKGICKAARSDLGENGYSECEKGQKHEENGEQEEIIEKRVHCMKDEPANSISQDDTSKQVSLGSGVLSPSWDHLATKNGIQNTEKFRHVKSVRSPMDSNRSSGLVRTNQYILGIMQNGTQGLVSNERKDNKVNPKETRNILSDSKIQLLEQRVKRLERELKEAAAVEVGLYSVVAEHGSSTNKVHAPARRLSRFYIHTGKVNSLSGRATAAKSAVSGLILVAKACGNDVPRLTFWLSNSIVLRAIISESLGEQQLPLSADPVTGKNGNKKSSPLKWQSLSSNGLKNALHEISDDWEEPWTFGTALEKVETWIFSRIIESIWWQTLTPHMQSDAVKAKGMLPYASSGDQEQGTFSLELWKKAFSDAYERICPVRAEGHECGCLHLLSRLIMEQCVTRLDVAMFNAILRESADDIPTDPVSDPISDASVLPIPVGKPSFAAGAQLKNAVGNWSRWLTDLFGIDDDGSLDDVSSTDEASDDERKGQDTSFKSFHLLNALSDLMMLPKDMLLSRTVRKEVCPTFSAALIRRVLNTFVPDEFCPEPIPRVVLEALNSEDPFEAEENSALSFPCAAAPIIYLPPSAPYISGILGATGNHAKLTRRGSLVLTKSYTSDDELDELDSSLSSIIIDTIQGSPSWKPTRTTKGNGSQSAVRYQLLREVWKNSE